MMSGIDRYIFNEIKVYMKTIIYVCIDYIDYCRGLLITIICIRYVGLEFRNEMVCFFYNFISNLNCTLQTIIKIKNYGYSFCLFKKIYMFSKNIIILNIVICMPIVSQPKKVTRYKRNKLKKYAVYKIIYKIPYHIIPAYSKAFLIKCVSIRYILSRAINQTVRRCNGFRCTVKVYFIRGMEGVWRIIHIITLNC